MLETEFDNLLDLLNLLVQTTNHVVCAVGYLLNHHEGNKRVDRGREEGGKLVGVAEEGDTLARCEFRDVDVVGNVDDCSPLVSMYFICSVCDLTIFAFGVNLHQHLLGSHDLHNLSNVAPRLLEQAELLAQ